ncbi:MAG TPA: hypothetical protein VKY85_11990 [Candidatus Angelobacter sp.]|nr:hypothetical protein [Candidatus Angelobacter sp.]
MQRQRISQVLGLVLLLAGVSWPQQVPVSIIVSVEAKHGKEVPKVYKEDVRVLHDHDRLQVTEWIPCQGAQAGLDLFVLMDDATDPDIGLQFDDVRKFIDAQPSDASIGVGYARNGGVQMAQNMTKDHAQAAKALRLPLGTGAMASPYLSLTELIKSWPQSENRREILMVSSGIDFLQGGPNDSYLQEAVDQAQRAAIQVYAIYTSSLGHAGHSYWRTTWGQNNLSRLTEETGGEFYIQGLNTPISFAPYLGQFADRLKHQYKLTFLANAGHKSEYQHIHLETEVTNAELVAQDNVYVPAAK